MLFEDIKAGDLVSRRIWDHETSQLITEPLIVVRVNRKTITALTRQCLTVRVSLADVIGAR